MRYATQGKRQGLQWTLTSILEDLDYADDLGLLVSRYQDIQQKTEQLNSTVNIGLKINTNRLRSCAWTPIQVNNKPLEDAENSHTWELKSPQLKTVTKTPTPGLAKLTKPLPCWNPHGDPLDLTSTLRSGSSTATSSASSCMDQNAWRHLWHQRENSKSFRPNAFDVYPQDILAKHHLERRAAQ